MRRVVGIASVLMACVGVQAQEGSPYGPSRSDSAPAVTPAPGVSDTGARTTSSDFGAVVDPDSATISVPPVSTEEEPVPARVPSAQEAPVNPSMDIQSIDEDAPAEDVTNTITPETLGDEDLPGDDAGTGSGYQSWQSRGGAVDAATTGTAGMGMRTITSTAPASGPSTNTVGMGTRTLQEPTSGDSGPATGYRTTDQFWRKVPTRVAADYSPHLYGPNAYWRETNAYWEDKDWYQATKPDAPKSRTNKGKDFPK